MGSRRQQYEGMVYGRGWVRPRRGQPPKAAPLNPWTNRRPTEAYAILAPISPKAMPVEPANTPSRLRPRNAKPNRGSSPANRFVKTAQLSSLPHVRLFDG